MMPNIVVKNQIVATTLSFYPEVWGIYLFGSYSTDAATTESDVDLALLNLMPLTPDTAFRLKAALSFQLKKDVDLVDLLRCDTVTAAQVVYTAQRLYTFDEFQCASFEMTALSKYALLNEERRGILEDIKARGKIYG